ncbi:hypothetical protein BYT27DRAFT_7250298 [Phlegmacium glaucopus]|nr:hypothetical protein BYT27DRAFT_7250298 [Phlegmacium glaucopus]
MELALFGVPSNSAGVLSTYYSPPSETRFGEVANAGAENWYRDTFLPKMRITRKDPLVLSKGSIAADGIAK